MTPGHGSNRGTPNRGGGYHHDAAGGPGVGQSPTAAMAALATRASGGERSVELFTQLQSIVVQLSSRAVDDKKAVAAAQAQLHEYAEMLQNQEELIEHLKAANAEIAAERDEAVRQLRRTAAAQHRNTSGNHDVTANGVSAVAQEIFARLSDEQRERVLMEEQHARLLEEQQRTIHNLEARLRTVSGAHVGGELPPPSPAGDHTPGGAGTSARRTPGRKLAGGAAADSPPGAGSTAAAAIAAKTVPSPRSSTPSRFAQQRQQQLQHGGHGHPRPHGRASTSTTHSDEEDDRERRLDESPIRGADSPPHHPHLQMMAEVPPPARAGAAGVAEAAGNRPEHTSPTRTTGSATEAATGVHDRDRRTKEAFERFAEAINSVKLGGNDNDRRASDDPTAGAATSAGVPAVRPVREPGLHDKNASQQPWAAGLRSSPPPPRESTGGGSRSSSQTNDPTFVSPARSIQRQREYPSPPNRMSAQSAHPSHDDDAERRSAPFVPTSSSSVPRAAAEVAPLHSATTIDDLIRGWRSEHLEKRPSAGGHR